MLRIGVAVAAAVLVTAAVVALLVVVRPSASVASAVDPDVTIECAGFESDDDCMRSGDALLADGPPSTTFEMDDLARLEIGRPPFGEASTCSVAWFIESYPREAVWHEEVPCEPSG